MLGGFCWTVLTLWVYLNIRLCTGEPADLALFCLGNWVKVKWECQVFI